MSGSVKVLVEFHGQKRHQDRPVLVSRKMGSRGLKCCDRVRIQAGPRGKSVNDLSRTQVD